MRLRLISLIILLLANASFLFAQNLPQTFRVGPIYSENPGELSAVVELPPGLTPKASDFRLLVDGKAIANAREVKPFGESGKPLALLFCVDVSGSMKGGPLKETKESLLSFLGTAASRPEDRFGVVSFADAPDRESLIDQPREQLTEKINGLRTRGGYTRLYTALYHSLDLLQRGDVPKLRRIVVISDGNAEGESQTLENVIAKAQATNIPIFAVGRGKVGKDYQQVLSGLAASTGGEFITVRPDVLNLREALERIYRQLLETRLLMVSFKYDASGTVSRPALLELKLSGDRILTAPLPEAIPPARPSMWAKWLLLSLAVFLVLVIVLLVFVLTRRAATRKEPPAKSVPGKGEPAEASSPETARAIEESQTETRPERKGTLVGSAYFAPPGPGKPNVLLVGISGPAEGKRLFVEKELFRIGADPENDLYLANDEFVSGVHASLRYDHGSLALYDEGSRNGTFVNEKEVVDRSRPLGLGDRIRIGKSTFQLEKAAS
jgi:hypothetical protein